jgi:hypothetical protein
MRRPSIAGPVCPVTFHNVLRSRLRRGAVVLRPAMTPTAGDAIAKVYLRLKFSRVCPPHIGGRQETKSSPLCTGFES